MITRRVRICRKWTPGLCCPAAAEGQHHELAEAGGLAVLAAAPGLASNMLCYTMLYYITILYRTVLYCAILYYTVLYYNIPYYTMP